MEKKRKYIERYGHYQTPSGDHFGGCTPVFVNLLTNRQIGQIGRNPAADFSDISRQRRMDTHAEVMECNRTGQAYYPMSHPNPVHYPCEKQPDYCARDHDRTIPGRPGTTVHYGPTDSATKAYYPYGPIARAEAAQEAAKLDAGNAST